jgi:hypothetical protein
MDQLRQGHMCRRVPRPAAAKTHLRVALTFGMRSVIAVFALSLVMACEATPQRSSPATTPTPAGATAPVPTPVASPTGVATAFHWQAPVDGATVKNGRLTLRATADGAAEGATVTFSVDWPGSAAKPVCPAVAAKAAAWTCVVDLLAIHAPRGAVVLRFDVDRGDGAVETSPDGYRTLKYRPPAPTWRRARTIMPKTCDAPSLTVGSGRYHAASTCGRAIRYAEGSATGRWTLTTLHPPARHVESNPQLAIDGNTLYLAYTRYGPVVEADTCGGPFDVRYEDVGVYYRTRTLPDGAWSKPHKLGRADDILDSMRVVNGTIHAVVFAASGLGGPVVESFGGGVLVRERPKAVDGPISLRVGSDGKARLAYVASNGSIRLVTLDGIEGTSTTVAHRGKLVDPLLVLGPGNQPHLIWTRFAAEDGGCGGGTAGVSPQGTYYATVMDGEWKVERFTRETGTKSFVIDPATGAVHVLVNGNDRGAGSLRYFERAPGGGWTSKTLRASVDGGAIIRRDESDGTLVVVFKDGYDGAVQMLTRR